MESYISPKARKGQKSSIHGQGLLVVDEIKKGEIVAVKGGAILTAHQLGEVSIKMHAEMQIGDDLYIAPLSESDYEKSMMHLNHSCNPNLGMRGDIVFVALRDIQAGEELTVDYAMLSNKPTQFNCICRQNECRGEVTGNDWQRKDLQEKYKGYFSAFIASLIARFSSHS